MSALDRLFGLAEKMIRVISLRSIGIWSLAAFITISGIMVYENRDSILKMVLDGKPASSGPSTFNVSSSVKSHIKQFVDREDLVVGITILAVDVRYNRQVPVYWYSDETTIQRQMDNMFNGRFGGIPLFTSDDKNNSAIVSTINSEFACLSFADMGSATLFPGFEIRFPVICNMSVPPYFGQFAGYIAITLNRKPSTSELDFLKAESVNISTTLFTRDIAPHQK